MKCLKCLVKYGWVPNHINMDEWGRLIFNINIGKLKRRGAEWNHRNWIVLSNFMTVLQEYRQLSEDSGNNPGDKTLKEKFFEHEVVTVDIRTVST